MLCIIYTCHLPRHGHTGMKETAWDNLTSSPPTYHTLELAAGNPAREVAGNGKGASQNPQPINQNVANPCVGKSEELSSWHVQYCLSLGIVGGSHAYRHGVCRVGPGCGREQIFCQAEAGDRSQHWVRFPVQTHHPEENGQAGWHGGWLGRAMLRIIVTGSWALLGRKPHMLGRQAQEIAGPGSQAWNLSGSQGLGKASH